jgi:sulfur-oxidizing protein SoxA
MDGDAKPHFEAGRRLYNRRMGQMNLACANCHDANWGRNLYNERISQGHPNGFPAYRMEW